MSALLTIAHSVFPTLPWWSPFVPLALIGIILWMMNSVAPTRFG